MKASLLTVVATIILCLTTAYSQTQPPQPTASPSPAGSPEVKAADPGIANNAPADSPANAKPTGGRPALTPEKANPVRLPIFAKPPVIDGKLDDEVWKNAVVLKDFYQTQPGDNIAPSKPTEVMLGRDERFLYVAFHCFDEPDKVRANISKRDNIFNDDYVGILFDTFNDKRKAYEFDFNPLGIQADGIWTEGMGEDFSLDIVHESKGILTSDGTPLKWRYRSSQFAITAVRTRSGAYIFGGALSGLTTS
ncbi:MAG: sugar-binding protein [Pyrinomonadaceae bacterium]